MSFKKVAVILAHSFIGWALCAAVIGIGSSLTSMETTLIIHAAAVPFIFALVSGFYFQKFAYTKPLPTALIFLGFVIFMDFFLVAMIIRKSFDMFSSLEGTWLPFAFIFLSTFTVGKLAARKS